MLETAPTAIHRDDASLPCVTVDSGVDLRVLQVKIRAGLWVIRNRCHPCSSVANLLPH